jgi:outer membrane protein OmpA-like peptidoglycan-associated protein
LLLSQRRFEEFLRLAIALDAGVPRLEDINGIGPATAAALRRSGINSVGALAGAVASQIAAALGNANYPANKIEQWQAHAVKLRDGDHDAILKLAGLPRLEAMASYVPETSSSAVDKASATSTAVPFGMSVAKQLLVRTALAAALSLAATSGYELASEQPSLGGALPAWCTPDAKPKVDPRPVLSREVECHFERTLQTDKLFESTSTELTEAGKAAINVEGANFMRKFASDQKVPQLFLLTGHADRERYLGKGGNDGLSRRRAAAVREALTKVPGIGSTNIPIEIRGQGADEPTGKTEQCTAIVHRDRREQARRRHECYKEDRRVQIEAFLQSRQEAAAKAAAMPPSPPKK